MRAGLQSLRSAGAVVEDLAAVLVAKDNVLGYVHGFTTGQAGAEGCHLWGMQAGVQIAAADAAGERLDQHLAVPGFWIGQRVDDDVALAEDGGAHTELLFSKPYETAAARACQGWRIGACRSGLQIGPCR
mgnify:CR=1 FL=1